ncbi:MAG TPA: type II toxin-antitoxin system Phd/YefM family antitoxin [Gemmatimonadales bacterium]|jgi:hypothetical protein
MRTYTYSEARQRLAALLDQARREGRVQIRRQDGSTFVVQPVVSDRSPLDVPGVRTRLRRGELVALVRDERERSAGRVLMALSNNKRLQPTKARRRTKARKGKN